MTNILRVESSIKGEGSVSRKLTDRLMARLVAANPGATVVTRDVSTGINTVDANWIGAIFTPAEARTAAQKDIVAYADVLLNEVRAADIIVIGLPVYNFGVPSQLKSWIDQLARKGEPFSYSEAGPKGHLTGKKAIIAMASDGTKRGSAIDFASGYVKHMMNFFGITDVELVGADAIAYAPDTTVPAALQEVDALAL